MPDKIDTLNKFLVSQHDRWIMVSGLPFPPALTPDDALLLAAYLVALAEPHASNKFDAVRQAVEKA